MFKVCGYELVGEKILICLTIAISNVHLHDK